MSEQEKIRINLTLKGDAAKRFKAVKEHAGVDRNTNVLRMLVAEKYREIQRGTLHDNSKSEN